MGKKTISRDKILKNLYTRLNGSVSFELLQDVYEVIIDFLFEKLKNSEFVWIPGFGSFYPKIKKDKKTIKLEADKDLYLFIESYHNKER